MVLLAVAYTAVQAFSARNAVVLAEARLRDAQRASKVGDLDAALAALTAAQGHADSASRTAAGPTFRLLGALPIVGGEVRAGTEVLAAVRDVSQATRQTLEALSGFAVAGDEEDGIAVQAAVDQANALQGDMQVALAVLREAHRSLEGNDGRAAFIRNARGEAMSGIAEVIDQAEAATGLLDLANALLARDVPTRILLLAQNTWELRPSGGYVGTWGIFDLRDGVLRLDRYEDATIFPVSAMPTPYPLSAARPQGWAFTGVGWWSHFPTTAQNAAAMAQELTGEKVDGVVALTNHSFEALLEITGPIEVPGFDETVTAENVGARMLYHIEEKQPKDVPRKLFMENLADAVFDELGGLEGRAILTFFRTLALASQRRDAQLWFPDRALQELVVRNDLDGELEDVEAGTDYLSVVDANMGIDKANRDVDTSVAYRVRSQGRRLLSEVTVTMHNNGPEHRIFNRGYNSYVRVTVPMGSELVDAADDALLIADEDGPHRTYGLGAFVPIGETVTRVFRYRLPATITSESYELTWQPQAGSTADVSIDIELPGRVVDARLNGRDGLRRIIPS